MTQFGGLVLIVLEVIAIAVALVITATSLRAYRRHQTRAYGLAFAGFLCLTLGIASEGILFRVGSPNLTLVHTVETLLFVVGFGFLYGSIR